MPIVVPMTTSSTSAGSISAPASAGRAASSLSSFARRASNSSGSVDRVGGAERRTFSSSRRLASSERSFSIAAEERVRASSDRRWTIAFLITLFAIHSARLQSDGTLLGYAAPAIAVIGDAALALLFAFLVATPLAISLSNVAAALILLWLLRRRLGRLELKESGRAVALILVASAALAGVSYGVWWLLDNALGDEFVAQLVSVSIALVAGGAAYLGACWVLRVRELRPLLALMRSRRGRRSELDSQ